MLADGGAAAGRDVVGHPRHPARLRRPGRVHASPKVLYDQSFWSYYAPPSFGPKARRRPPAIGHASPSRSPRPIHRFSQFRVPVMAFPLYLQRGQGWCLLTPPTSGYLCRDDQGLEEGDDRHHYKKKAARGAGVRESDDAQSGSVYHRRALAGSIPTRGARQQDASAAAAIPATSIVPNVAKPAKVFFKAAEVLSYHGGG